jgi:hypothetical protein
MCTTSSAEARACIACLIDSTSSSSSTKNEYGSRSSCSRELTNTTRNVGGVVVGLVRQSWRTRKIHHNLLFHYLFIYLL